MGDWGGEFAGWRQVSIYRHWDEDDGWVPLDRPGPKRRGICLIRVSLEIKLSYFRASFLISFLFLLSFFKSSEDMASTP